MRFGVLILPDAPWSVARERWQMAERMGFEHAWTYDHLTWRSLRDDPWFAAVPTLVSAALATSHLRIGTLVASPAFRHPVTFAKELMTLDDISDGRVTAGIGAGGDGFDATALRSKAWARRERTERFEEFVTMLDRLLTETRTSYEGRYYVANEARAIPGCRQRPRLPFAIAATGPRGLRLAARYGAIWIASDSRGAGRELVERLAEACAAEDRDPGSLARLVLVGHRERPLASLEAFRDVAGRYADAGFTDLVVHWPRPDEPFAADMGVLERVAAEVLGERHPTAGSRSLRLTADEAEPSLWRTAMSAEARSV
jgi:alkanesulfonate monooxygenase SsuD/methylene tetrahydromethanopterin reductase-like flavin-dependent oxidoreductase (luciferase family)